MSLHDDPTTADGAEPTLGLNLARALEHTAGLVRSVHAHLEHGPFKRTRRRVRKQLDKLSAVLDAAQRNVLAQAPSEPDDGIDAALATLDVRLEHTLYHPLDKDDLAALRTLVKRQRKRLAVLTDTQTSAAA